MHETWVGRRIVEICSASLVDELGLPCSWLGTDRPRREKLSAGRSA